VTRRPNSGDHAAPAKKCMVMAVAIPVLAGACILGAGLLIGPRILGKVSTVKTSMLSW
jgi:hydrogenase maturation factor HypE